MDVRKLVGRNFVRLRHEKGLTQEDVEARSGYSQQFRVALILTAKSSCEL